MARPAASAFPTVRSEGGLLPADLLQRIVAADAALGGFAPADYGLRPRERLHEVISRAWQRARAFWGAFVAATDGLPPTASGVSETREQWVLPLLRTTGYQPEYRAAAEEIGGRSYRLSHRDGPVPLHIVSYRQELDRAGTDAEGGRRISPHALVQEYLNRSEGRLYGIVTNGHLLRLLRDNQSLTRLSYLEFDLRAMMEGAVYPDFALLWLCLHRSRLPDAEAEPSACWLERWRAQAETQGARAMGALRPRVEQAICALGTGFLAHPRNEALRERLRRGALTVDGLYAQLLRLLYRLLFLFVVEERDLLFPPEAGPADRRRYAEHYSLARLREVAARHRADERHDDLWRSLALVVAVLAGRREGLGLRPVGGGLFDEESCPDLDGALLPNAALAEAVLALSTVRVAGRWRRVNYRDMDVEELGGVYESLLERQPSVVVEAANPSFALVGSGSRKQTGSYYTPGSLVQELIRSALEPVIADRLAGARAPAQRERALLRISVCDPAAGSGHFLLAAARRLADELAQVRSGGREPSPEETRHALREVIRHCVYGVDVNPLAVDLCRLTLWLESHEPGRPLTFLDHRIRLGNSLVGATPELAAQGVPDGAFTPVAGDDRRLASETKKRNRQEREGQLSFGADPGAWATLQEDLALQALEIAEQPEDGLERSAEQRECYAAFRRERVGPASLALDLWTAAFFWPLTPEAPPPPTTALVWAAQRGEGAALSPEQGRELARLRAQHRFFHWPLEFPEAFADGGFDCVLGNPPWERIKLQEQEFFAERDPEIATAPNKAARQRLIELLPRRNPALAAAFTEAKRSAEGQSLFARESGRLPLTAVGDVNLYALFAEHDRALLNGQGRAGIVAPTGIATDDSTKRFFQDLADRGAVASLYDFENRKVFFEDVHASYKFCLLTMAGGPVARGELAFFLTSVDQLRDERRRSRLSAEDFALLNPNTRTCPVFRTRVDAELTRAIYRRVPVLVNERTGENPWGVSFLRMFDMSNDSHLFQDAPGPGLAPLYEAKLFHQYTHRWATYDGADARACTPAELADPSFSIRPRYWVPRAEVEARLAGRWDRQWLLGFRDIASATNERTAIFSLLPRVGVGHTAPLVMPASIAPPQVALFIVCGSSLILDYHARQKIGGTHLTFSYLNQLPVLPPSEFGVADARFIVPRVLELTYTAWDLAPFAEDLGYRGPPFPWDEGRRALLRAELDAYYAALYGLTRDELRYILDPQDVFGPDFPGETFRVLKERETRQYGEYRTRRLVLEAWDRLGLEPRNRVEAATAILGR